jgi:hypothetical protein
MALKTTPTTLGSLEFSEIKTNLTEFLKTQSIFSGYNFEGSAFQTVIDLLAYNTFYYAYYANMINAEAFLDSAQREESMVSLCKPLGYFVPSRTAAKALVQVSVPGVSVIPAGTRFVASNINGINYGFYNLQDIPVVEEVTEQFYIYEASRYVDFDALPTFNFDTQKIIITNQNFDIDSLRVTITEKFDEESSLTQEWTRVGNIGYTARIDENIYFIERTTNGFAIVFGSVNSVGRSIDSNIEKIQVRYIQTNGVDGNEINSFTAPSLASSSVVTVLQSSGGKSSPSLDEIRFLAPKWFAAQERAVTVNDYKALLLQSGYFTNENQFNVVGGQDLEPPKYGRVFISSSLDSTNELVPQIIDFLKERSVITVLPEYVETRTINFYTDFNFRLGPATPNTSQKKAQLTLALKSLFQSNYGASNQFNVTFSASDFIDLIRSNSNTDISGIIISPDDFSSYLREVISGTNEVLYNVGNELYLPPFEYVDITDQFDSAYVGPGEKAVIRMYVSSNSSKNNINNLQLWAIDTVTGAQEQITGVDIGYFIANKGVVKINPPFIRETATLTLLLAKKSFKIGLLDRVTHTYGTVAVL